MPTRPLSPYDELPQLHFDLAVKFSVLLPILIFRLSFSILPPQHLWAIVPHMFMLTISSFLNPIHFQCDKYLNAHSVKFEYILSSVN